MAAWAAGVGKRGRLVGTARAIAITGTKGHAKKPTRIADGIELIWHDVYEKTWKCGLLFPIRRRIEKKKKMSAAVSPCTGAWNVVFYLPIFYFLKNKTFQLWDGWTKKKRSLIPFIISHFFFLLSFSIWCHVIRACTIITVCRTGRVSCFDAIKTVKII